MMRPSFLAAACLVAMGVAVAPLAAQSIPGCRVSKQWTIERLGKDHFKLIGAVEVDCDRYKFYADEVEVFTDLHRIVATGNVVYTEAAARISGDRAVFDTGDKTGVFYHSAGSASLGEKANRDMFGGQEPDMYFYGDEVEKIGPDRYKVTRGGFTTCVQPTPRWELTSSSVVLRLDHYAVLRNTLLRVKNVPVFYLPIVYYPIKKDDRATGFLLPVYGTSTIKGFQLSNAFFWAISRNQDATLLFDWFSKTGMGYGGEYRYVLAPGSEGTIRTYWLKEHETSYTTATSGGQPTTTVVPARSSYQLRGSASQTLPFRLRLRGNVDYFSDVTVQQTYHQDIYNATLRQRGFGLNIGGNWRAYNISATFGRNETFYGTSNSYVTGGLPRINISRAATRVWKTPIVFGIGGELVRLVHGNRTGDAPFVNQGLTRIDVGPQVRAPFTRWKFLPMDASFSFRETWYSESLQNGIRVPEPVSRRYFKMGGSITGPILTRIWNTPNFGYAEKFKHVIEPSASFERITLINNDAQIIKFDGMDYIVGGTTRIAYGVTNRLLAKRREGPAGSSGREILSLTMTQSYYSNASASQYDYAYSTSFAGRPPSNFSPVSIGLRASPTTEISGGLRMEYDTVIGAFQSISASGMVSVSNWLQANGGWSTRKLPSQTAFLRSDNSITGGANLRVPSNRVGGNYAFNYDLGRSVLMQQRFVAYYNAQCCGFAVEYQAVNYPTGYGYPVSRDRRFNFSFTLAGLGTFSNLFGAFGGNTR